MCWRDVVDVTTYWADQPPVHEMVAGYLGVKPAPKASPRNTAPEMSFSELQAAMKAGTPLRAITNERIGA